MCEEDISTQLGFAYGGRWANNTNLEPTNRARKNTRYFWSLLIGPKTIKNTRDFLEPTNWAQKMFGKKDGPGAPKITRICLKKSRTIFAEKWAQSSYVLKLF